MPKKFHGPGPVLVVDQIVAGFSVEGEELRATNSVMI